MFLLTEISEILEPNKLSCWYRVSDSIRFEERETCVKTIGEDVQSGHKTMDMRGYPTRRLESPKKKHSNHGTKKGGGESKISI